MSSWLVTSALSTFWWTVVVVESLQPLFYHRSSFSKWLLVPYLCVLTQAVYSSLALLYDVYPTPTRRRARDILFVSMAFPISLSSVFMFWSLWLFDSEFVYPEWVNKATPLWLHHAVHSMPLAYTILEAFRTKHEPLSIGSCVAATTVVNVVYWVLSWLVWRLEGEWLYPIFSLLLGFERVMLVLADGLIIFLLMMAAIALDFVFWEVPSILRSLVKFKYQ